MCGLGQVHPVRRRAAEEEVVGPVGRGAVAVLAGPGEVALARGDDGAGEVEGERRDLPAVGADVRSVTAGSPVLVVALE